MSSVHIVFSVLPEPTTEVGVPGPATAGPEPVESGKPGELLTGPEPDPIETDTALGDTREEYRQCEPWAELEDEPLPGRAVCWGTQEEQVKHEIFRKLRRLDLYSVPVPLRTWTEVLFDWALGQPAKAAEIITADLFSLGYSKEDSTLMGRHCVEMAQRVLIQNDFPF